MPLKHQKIRLGTRGSPLALIQTHMVKDALLKISPDLDIEIIPLKTSGDWTPSQGEKPLPQHHGGKALFTKELEDALMENRIDAAIHSMKDVQAFLPQGLTITAMLPREDPRDAFLSNNSQNIQGLTKSSTIGTTSPRRTAFLQKIRPDLNITPLRGNVHTRMNKLEANQVDGIVLAAAGLKRLGLDSQIRSFLSIEEMLPCAGQGAIGIEVRNDNKISDIFSQINHAPTFLAVTCEREVLKKLNASCNTPIGVHAVCENEKITLQARLVSIDGKAEFIEHAEAPANSLSQATALGQALGEKLKQVVPPEILE